MHDHMPSLLIPVLIRNLVVTTIQTRKGEKCLQRVMMAVSCDILDHAEIDTGKVIWDLLTYYLAVHREKKIRPMTRNICQEHR